MTARDNPFAPGRLRRVLGFDPRLVGGSWEALDARWAALGRRAAVTGHRGSGKSSLLEAWAERLDEPPLRLFFNESKRVPDDADRARLDDCAGRVVIVDGEDHLSWPQRRRLRRALRAAAGLLVARERRGPWPELIRLRSDPALAAVLLERAAPEWAAPFQAEAAARWRAAGGNLRELFLGCYDELAAGQKAFEKIS
jgi:hypothetical protein